MIIALIMSDARMISPNNRVAGHARFWKPFEGLALLTASLLDAKEDKALVSAFVVLDGGQCTSGSERDLCIIICVSTCSGAFLKADGELEPPTDKEVAERYLSPSLKLE